ncbi:MAG: SLBB domain-containing protein [Chitinophagaceae bacterium]
MQFFKKFLFFIILFSFICIGVSAQDLLRSNTITQINIDKLSDADILKYQQQIKAMGLTESQAEQIALARGMPATEIAKLKQRLVDLNNGVSSSSSKNSRDSINNLQNGRLQNNIDSTDTAKQIKPLIDPRIFGSELFNNTTLNFEPNLRIATPMNYTVGPDDQLEITVFGVQEITQDVTVSPEGSIYIPQVGQVKVAGLTIEAATARIKDYMSRSAYPTLRAGTSRLTVNLGNIRSIKVTIIGANRPGNYTLSSLSTVFNALFAAGGPTNNGSFREIQLIRNGTLIRTIDLYRFLVNGDQSDNVSLQENDVIRIPTYKMHVEVDGYVKRPGIFELLPNETFSDLLKYSSGFSDSAYKASVKIIQFTDKEFRVKDINSAEYANYKPQQGDQFIVDKILIRYTNRVNITGAVFRPGIYELDSNMTLKDLIQKADGLREDAYTARGQIIRLKEDLTKEIVSFNVQQELNNNNSLKLKREDSIIIKSIFDLRDEYYVSIQGEIRSPGYYEYSENLGVKDVILQAGGLTDAAYPQRIEVARVINRDTLTGQDVRASEIIDINGISDLSLQQKNIELRPFDVVTVRRKPGYLELQSVTVRGELQYPGPYVISQREERVSDLIKRAGGFTPEAYIQGAYIKRYNDNEEQKQLQKQKIENIQNQLNDSTKQIVQNVEREYDQIPLNAEKLLKNPGSAEDVVLQPRDELYVPKFTAEVTINGSVLFPTQIPYNNNYNAKDYISAAGGFADNAKKGKLYVLYANGKARSTKRFLFFRSYPSIKPGTEIIVPEKAERKNRLTSGETIGIASALASLAGVVIAILRL